MVTQRITSILNRKNKRSVKEWFKKIQRDRTRCRVGIIKIEKIKRKFERTFRGIRKFVETNRIEKEKNLRFQSRYMGNWDSCE